MEARDEGDWGIRAVPRLLGGAGGGSWIKEGLGRSRFVGGGMKGRGWLHSGQTFSWEGKYDGSEESDGGEEAVEGESSVMKPLRI